MSSQDWIGVIGLVVGIGGLAFALYQSWKTRKANRIIKDWGGRIRSRLELEHRSLLELQEAAANADSVQWKQMQERVRGAVGERAASIADLGETMLVFIRDVSNGG